MDAMDAPGYFLADGARARFLQKMGIFGHSKHAIVRKHVIQHPRYASRTQHPILTDSSNNLPPKTIAHTSHIGMLHDHTSSATVGYYIFYHISPKSMDASICLLKIALNHERFLRILHPAFPPFCPDNIPPHSLGPSTSSATPPPFANTLHPLSSRTHPCTAYQYYS
jgi:hypothetical protein